MAVRYIGTTQANPQVLGNIVIGASSGGTLAGAQAVLVVFDDTVFDATNEGKQRLVAALYAIAGRVKSARSWPLDSTS